MTSGWEIWCESVAKRVATADAALEYAWAAHTWPDERPHSDRDFGHFANQGRFVSMTMLGDGRVRISGLEAVITPIPPGGKIPEATALFPGGLAQLLTMDSEGADLAANAIVAWLSFDETKTQEARRAIQAHIAKPAKD